MILKKLQHFRFWIRNTQLVEFMQKYSKNLTNSEISNTSSNEIKQITQVTRKPQNLMKLWFQPKDLTVGPP